MILYIFFYNIKIGDTMQDYEMYDGDTKKGNRPSYIKAAKPDIAVPLYEKFVSLANTYLGSEARCGVFGADMKVSLLNDGPVTIIVDSKLKF